MSLGVIRNREVLEHMEQGSKKDYEYYHLPENIRQIGESTGQKRIYIEDYVLTYIRRVFQEHQESGIVVFIGHEGKQEAAGCLFLYGALEIRLDNESGSMTESEWEELYQQASHYFPGGQLMGWGLGVNMWNSQIDQKVRTMQEKEFGDAGRVLFLADLSEKEEKVFLCNNQNFEELSSYFIYFERNPQMQEYMLRVQEPTSMESEYEDQVTESIRTVIHEKKSKHMQAQYLLYGTSCALFIVLLLGGNLLLRSLAKINSLEKTIETLSAYVTENKQDELVISRALSSEFPFPSEVASAGAAQTPLQGTQTSTNQSQKGQAPQITLKPRMKNKITISNALKEKNKKTDEILSGGVEPIKKTYTVRKGDTLSQIVWEQYGSLKPMKRVLEVNQIKDSDAIYVGQRILLPEF